MIVPPSGPRIVLLTGLSGSGKSTAVNALEDLGFFCVDNLPSDLLQTLLQLLDRNLELQKVALVMDIRDAAFPKAFPRILADAEAAGYRLEVVFLDASDEVLVRRFSETRRKHPLDATGSGDIPAAIARERELLEVVRERADIVVDTSEMNVHQLRRQITDEFQQAVGDGAMTVRLVSFGFRNGPPANADLVMDVRFLPNPHFIPALRDKDGRDEDVSAKVLGSEDGATFMGHFQTLLDFLLPRYQSEGKAYLTIGVGCTGGKHRSVAVVEAMRDHLKDAGVTAHVIHRDLEENGK